jgi:hypothetical protein
MLAEKPQDHRRGWPVVAMTRSHSSLSGMICLLPPLTKAVGTWNMLLFQWPINTSVLPAIAAWTA